MDAASLELAISDCKERWFSSYTYAPETIALFHAFSGCQMEQESKNQYSENSPQNKDHQRKTPQIKGAEAKARNQRLLIYEAVSVLLIAFAGIAFFINHALALLSIFLLLVGAIFAALCLRLGLIGHGAKKKTANRWFLGLVFGSTGLSVMLTAIVFPRTSVPPKPNLRFALITSHATNSLLVITNAFLPMDGAFSAVEGTGAVLAIATFQEEKIVRLQFEFAIDPLSSVEIDGLEVVVGIPEAALFTMEPGWNAGRTPDSEKQNPVVFNRFKCKFPTPLFSGDGEPLPGIVFNSTQPTIPDSNRLIPVMFNVSSKGVMIYRIGFWLAFFKMPSGDSTLVIPQMFSRVLAIGFSNDEFVVSHIPR